ncbi:MAG: hypothetical protein WCH65_08800 [bacterium]
MKENKEFIQGTELETKLETKPEKENKTKKTRKGTAQEIEDIFSGKIVPKFHCVDYSSKGKRKELRKLKEKLKEIKKRKDINRDDLNKWRPKDFNR